MSINICQRITEDETRFEENQLYLVGGVKVETFC